MSVAVFALGAMQATASEPDVVRVEEDWVLEVGVPSPAASGPQVVTAITPGSDIEGNHAVFEINHNTLPEFGAGGLQLQCWDNEEVLRYGTLPDTSAMATDGETVTFTMSMSLTGAKLWFEVLEGSSTTWGAFGGEGYLKVHATAAGLDDLSGYSPETSVKHSRIGFASNRVRRLVLKEVRYYSSDGLVARDTQERVVFERSSDG